jgi:hypothetical protein
MKSILISKVTGLKWMHPMVLLGDGAQGDARFCLFGDSANLDRCMICT